MGYIRNNILVLVILVGAIFSEYFHLFFDDMVHSTYIDEFGNKEIITFGDMIYYLINQLFQLFILIIVYIGIDNKKKASKFVMLGVIFWFGVELLELVLQLAYVTDCRLFINSFSWLQISVIFFWTLFSIVGYTKYKL